MGKKSAGPKKVGPKKLGADKAGLKKSLRRCATPADAVKLLMKAGKVKKKCCRSKSRCKKCPILALKQVKADFAKAA